MVKNILNQISKKISNFFFSLKFFTNKVQPNTVLIIEVNDYHTELFPSFVYYLKKLGFNVEIMANFGQKGNLARLGVKNIYYFTLLGFKKALMFKKIKEYRYLIFTSNKIFWSFGNEAKTDICVFDKFNLNHPNIAAVIHDLNEKLPPKGVKKIVLSKILKQDSDFFVVNPCYFIKNGIKGKNKKTVFITTGKLEPIRKSAGLLFDTIRTLLDKDIAGFEIRIIGNNAPDMVPDDLKNVVKILGRLDFEKMYNELSKADFFLPLLDINNESHKRYVQTKTSGSFQIIRGFLLPPVIHKAFGNPHGFSEKNSILYEDNFCEAVKKCIDMKNEEYANLCRALLKERDEIMISSALELKKMINS